MQTLFYRKKQRAFRLFLTLSMLWATVFMSPFADAAPDPDMVLPPIVVDRSMQKVAMVVPYHLDRPPLPVRKPRADEGAMIARTAWDQGLLAYRRGEYQSALQLFIQTQAQTGRDPWLQSAAAFWAARTARQLGEKQQVKQYLKLAAQYDRTFYGQIAAVQLGQTIDFSWDAPMVDPAGMARLQSSFVGQVVADHVANGRLTDADQALQTIVRDGDAELRLAALAFAMHYGLPATALKLAGTVQRETGTRYDAAYYPVGAWVENHDFRIDRALVHAIIRQESSFNPRARSHMGAVGLMQLLPSTADYVVKVKAGGSVSQGFDLTRSTHNLDLGQHYLEYLLGRSAVKGDIMKMLVAYNAGPGNLSKWQREYADVTDPLLFIELIPSAETRAYVEKVMASYWIYRDRFGMGNPTLHMVADGKSAPLMARSTWFAGLSLKRYIGL